MRGVGDQIDADFVEADAVAAERIQRRRLGLRQERTAVHPLAEVFFEDDHRRPLAPRHQPLGFLTIGDQFEPNVGRGAEVVEHHLRPRFRRIALVARQAAIASSSFDAT